MRGSQGQGFQVERPRVNLSLLISHEAQGKVDRVVTSTGANNHVGIGGRVTLQTAQAIICGKQYLRVKSSFYTGSHQSFVTALPKILQV